MFGDLDGINADAAGRAEDEHLLAGFQFREIAQEDERGDRAEGDGCRLVIACSGGHLRDRGVLADRQILRMRAAVGEAEDGIAEPEAGDVLAARDDPAGELVTEDLVPRREQAEHQPAGQPHDAGKGGGAQPPVGGGDGGRMDLHQDFAVADFGPRNVVHIGGRRRVRSCRIMPLSLFRSPIVRFIGPVVSIRTCYIN